MSMGEKAIEGIVLGAGFGTRMLPLTGEIPKPLLPVAGVTPLEIAARRLMRAGARRIHVNLHHLGGEIRGLAQRQGLDPVFHPESDLLGTGGGIGAMADGLAAAETILLHNGDVVSSIDFRAALLHHARSGALVTLVLLRPGRPERTPPAAVTLAGDGAVTGIDSGPRQARAGERRLGYTGLAVLDAEALDFFPRRGRQGPAAVKKDLVPVLLEMIERRPGSVAGWEAGASGDAAAWGEIGTPAAYLDIHRRILVEKTLFDPLIPPPPLPLRAGPGAKIDPGASWNGFLDVGRNALIEKGSRLEDCVVMDGATVRSGSVLRAAVVYRGGAVEVR